MCRLSAFSRDRSPSSFPRISPQHSPQAPLSPAQATRELSSSSPPPPPPPIAEDDEDAPPGHPPYESGDENTAEDDDDDSGQISPLFRYSPTDDAHLLTVGDAFDASAAAASSLSATSAVVAAAAAAPAPPALLALIRQAWSGVGTDHRQLAKLTTQLSSEPALAAAFPPASANGTSPQYLPQHARLDVSPSRLNGKSGEVLHSAAVAATNGTRAPASPSPEFVQKLAIRITSDELSSAKHESGQLDAAAATAPAFVATRLPGKVAAAPDSIAESSVQSHASSGNGKAAEATSIDVAASQNGGDSEQVHSPTKGHRSTRSITRRLALQRGMSDRLLAGAAQDSPRSASEIASAPAAHPVKANGAAALHTSPHSAQTAPVAHLTLASTASGPVSPVLHSGAASAFKARSPSAVESDPKSSALAALNGTSSAGKLPARSISPGRHSLGVLPSQQQHAQAQKREDRHASHHLSLQRDQKLEVALRPKLTIDVQAAEAQIRPSCSTGAEATAQQVSPAVSDEAHLSDENASDLLDAPMNMRLQASPGSLSSARMSLPRPSPRRSSVNAGHGAAHKRVAQSKRFLTLKLAAAGAPRSPMSGATSAPFHKVASDATDARKADQPATSDGKSDDTAVAKQSPRAADTKSAAQGNQQLQQPSPCRSTKLIARKRLKMSPK